MIVEEFACRRPGKDVAERDGKFEDVDADIHQREGLVEIWRRERMGFRFSRAICRCVSGVCAGVEG